MLLGIDIGGTRIKAGLVDESGAVIDFRSAPTPVTAAAFRSVVAALLRELDHPVSAAGIGCKGVIHPLTTRVETLPGTLHFLEGSLLAELVPGVPVIADNDARAAMAGEAAWGAARGRNNALMLTLGTGVGGAVVAEGRLLRGATGVAGHLGHLTVSVDGDLCICGNRGCLETLFSARAIEAAAMAAVLRGYESTLTDSFTGHACELTCHDVFSAAAQNDSLARDVIQRAVGHLGAALAGLLLAFDPEIVIVGGQISEAGPALFTPLEEEVAWRTQKMLRRRVPIVRAQVTDGVAGAAALTRTR